MYVLENLGQAGAHQKIVPGATATGLFEGIWNYKEWLLHFDSGDNEPAAGSWIVAVGDAARAIVVSATLDAAVPGSWAATTAAGTLRLRSVSGTFANNDVIKSVAEADALTVDGTISPVMSDYKYRGMVAQTALVTCYGNTALMCLDGSTPDQTSLIGQPMPANSSIVIKDINIIQQMKFIDYTNGSACIIQVTLYF